jgi:hypothetical protein
MMDKEKNMGKEDVILLVETVVVNDTLAYRVGFYRYMNID